MKRLVAIALFLTAAAIPAFSQRGGSHGGSFGRAPSGAPAFHSGPSFSSPSHFSGVSRAPMSTARPVTSARPSFHSANRYPGNRYPIGRPVGNRFPNRRPVPFRGIRYGFSSGISYVPYPFFGSPFYDDIGDSGYDEAPPVPYAAPAPDSTAYGYTFPQDQPPYDSEPQAHAEIVRPSARPEPAQVTATTLIFKDGRAPEQIGNYIATHSTVTVIEGERHHEIPVADLDIPATVKANREAGTGFQLPAASH